MTPAMATTPQKAPFVNGELGSPKQTAHALACWAAPETNPATASAAGQRAAVPEYWHRPVIRNSFRL